VNRVDLLEQQAREATGLGDFGDHSYREGLERLVASADRQARLNATGAAAFDAQVVGLLANRLQVEHWYRQHPEIEQQEIMRPLIGLGLPRTGSTALSCLLAEDPAARSIRNWEAQSPCPPPESDSEHNDPRIARAEAAMVRRNQLFPRMKTMVPSTATSPTECQTFMGYDFKSQLFQASARIPDYVRWLNHEADLVPTYRYVKRVLKLLQWRCPPRRWRLKNPSHILFIDALSEVFPDARFWMTHRDIGSVLPSVTDLYLEMHRAFTDPVDKPWLAEVTTEFCELGMRRVIAFRDRGNDDRFFDIHFESLMRDPFPVLEQLYAFLGEQLSDQARSRMEAWRESTPRDKHGRHTYAANEFGFDSDTLRERFSFYHDRFQVTHGNDIG
jgi:hypothetical protein